jgi:hypothetical protein
MIYEEPKLCPTCSKPMRLVPAGVSKKTNKPYEAFLTCDNCKGFKKNTGNTIILDRLAAVEDDVEKIKKWLREKYNLERI